MKLIRELQEQTQGWKVLRGKELKPKYLDGGRVGSLDDITYDELVSVLGQPSKITHRSQWAADATVVCWVIRGDDGTIARIYDYKTSDAYHQTGPMDLGGLADDDEIQDLVKKANSSEARRLGVSNITCWSIGGSDMDLDAEQYDRHTEKNSPFVKKLTRGAAVELVKKIFGEKAVHSIYDKEFRDLITKFNERK